MKRLKSYIAEKRDKLLVQRMPNAPVSLQTGLRNPSYGEVVGFLNRTKYKEARFVATIAGDLLVWDAVGALHAHVAAGELGKDLTGGGFAADTRDYGQGTIFLHVDTDEPTIEFSADLFGKGGEKWIKASRSLKALSKKMEIV